jgi:hypothetical protein
MLVRIRLLEYSHKKIMVYILFHITADILLGRRIIGITRKKYAILRKIISKDLRVYRFHYLA